MQKGKYDVVIIGSGLGGLASGALLAHWGYHTLIVEKMGNIGGRWATYEIDGFKVPAGALAIHYYGTELESIYHEVGKEANFIPVPKLYYRIGGTDHEMPAKGSISIGLDIINKLESDKVKLSSGFAKAISKQTVMNAFRKGTKEYKPGEGMSFKDWLLQYTDSEGAHAIFDTIANTLCGAHSYELSANALFGFFVKMGGSREVAIAPNGNIENAEMLAEVVRGNGDIWVNTEAKQITVSGKNARSVIVSRNGDDIELDTQVVISDGGPRKTVELTRGEGFNENYLRDLRLKMKPHPVTMCYVASDVPLWPESGEKAILMIVGAWRITSVIPLSCISPNFAPPGQHLMFCFGGPPSNDVHLNPEVEQQQMLLDLKEQFPLFAEHGRVLKMVSKDIDDELPEVRTRVGLGMPVETPLRNLFNVGDGCPAFGLGGSNAAVENAGRVARLIKKSYKPGK